MDQRIDAIEAEILHSDLRSDAVSRWSVGMQLHHSLLAVEGIAGAVARSTPGAGGPSSRHPVLGLILISGWIPRARGRTPAEAEPVGAIPQAALHRLCAAAREALTAASDADPAAWWKHPSFGLMRRDRALRFAAIHTRHHLKIVRDIRAALGR